MVANRLHFPFKKANPALEAALEAASQILAAQPDLAQLVGYGGTARLTCPVPTGYSLATPISATHLAIRFNVKTRGIFELAEIDVRSSGGWIGSCVSTQALTKALKAWITAQQPQQLGLGF